MSDQSKNPGAEKSATGETTERREALLREHYREGPLSRSRMRQLNHQIALLTDIITVFQI